MSERNETVLNEKVATKEIAASSRAIKKKKPKKKPVKEAAAVAAAENLKIQGLPKKKKQQKERPANGVYPPKIKLAGGKGNAKEKKKEKKNDNDNKQGKELKDSNLTTEKVTSEDLSEEQLTKLERKKNKKKAQKLKKLQKKKEISEGKQVGENQSNITKAGPKKPTEKNKVKNKKAPASPQKGGTTANWYDPAVLAATVFVGNLPINTKRSQLSRLFGPYGLVNSMRFRSESGKEIFNTKARKECGSLNAYVVLSSAEAATMSLALNGTEFKGAHLRVNLANTNLIEDNTANVKRTLFVGNLKHSATEEKLREIFSSCGEIDYIRCLRASEKKCKGVAYVCFKSADSINLGLELNETLLDDRPIHVERYSIKKLGAKATRDAKEAIAEKKSKKKVVQGQTTTKGLQNKAKKGNAGNLLQSSKGDKKGEFRGIKAGKITKRKNKKPPNAMQKLAKKIAPKAKD